MTAIDKIKARITAYEDGALSANEFLGFVIESIGKVWKGMDSGDTQESTDLANWLAR